MEATHLDDEELAQMLAVQSVHDEARKDYSKAEARMITAEIALSAVKQTLTERYQLAEGDVIRGDGKIVRGKTEDGNRS